jgi:23S rRNA-/tRNA-specific pseudouridylate synthase
VNGREALGDLDLPMPCKIEYYEPKFKIADAGALFPQFSADYLIYRDDYLVAVYKPPGLASMPAKEQRHYSVKASVERLIGAKVHLPSRLDVSAQGLMIMSVSELAHRKLQQAFEHRLIAKEYLCASAAESLWEQKTVELPLGRDPAHPVLRRVDCENGKNAITKFTKLSKARSGSTSVDVFRAQPVTGRTHQIRVHAAQAGIPLFGDRFYGGREADYLHLVSFAVELRHPVTEQILRITLPERFWPEWVSFGIRSQRNRDHTPSI